VLISNMELNSTGGDLSLMNAAFFHINAGFRVSSFTQYCSSVFIIESTWQNIGLTVMTTYWKGTPSNPVNVRDKSRDKEDSDEYDRDDTIHYHYGH